jgi:hypothetical protein
MKKSGARMRSTVARRLRQLTSKFFQNSAANCGQAGDQSVPALHPKASSAPHTHSASINRLLAHAPGWQTDDARAVTAQPPLASCRRPLWLQQKVRAER